MDDRLKRTLKTYQDTAEWYAEAHEDPEAMGKFLDRFEELLKGRKAVDIGCGHGRDISYLVEKDLDVTGVDISPEMLEVAREKVGEASFVMGDMRDLGFEDGSFDGLWSCAAFHHIPKEEASETLEEFYRVLDNDGVLFLSVKEGTGEGMVEKDYYDGNQKFFAFYSEEELRQRVEEAGFRVIESGVNTDAGVSGSNWVNVFARKES